MRRWVMASSVVAAIACGGSTGTPGGSSDATAIAYLFAPMTCTSGGTSVSKAGIAVALASRSIPDACSTVGSACTQYRDVQGTVLEIVNYATVGTAQAVGTGTYHISSYDATVPSGTYVYARTDNTNATCAPSGAEAGTGTLTITSLASDSVRGTYDITLNDASGTTRSGSFSATICAGSPPGGDLCTTNTSATTCASGTPSCQ